MTTTAIDQNVIATYKRWPVEFESGRGCKLYDSAGREYLDLVAGLAVVSVGHGHPRVIAAAKDQLDRLVHVSNLYVTRPQQDLAAKLASITSGMRSFFCNSGAEAVESAIKLARKHGGPHGRSRIVAFDGAFHGRTLGALTATGQPGKKESFEPLLPGFTHVPYGDIGAVEAAVTDDVAAVLVEPIQGEAGVVMPPDGFHRDLRALCDERGVLVIADEVQTGVARTGAWFASELFDLRPDVMCLAKGLAAGLPIGVCLAVPSIASSFVPGDHASTFGGGPVQCAAALAVLEVVEDEGLIERAARLGGVFKSAFSGTTGAIEEVRGAGLLIGIELDAPKAHAVAALCLEKGVLVNDAAPDVVRICPPLVISDDEVATAIEVVQSCIGEVCG